MPRDIVSPFSGLRPEVSALALGAWAAAVSAYDLTPSHRDRIKSAYVSLGEFFRSDPRFKGLAIEVHPQGSVAIGTTVRPIGSSEFDVDLVLSLDPLTRYVHPGPVSLLRDLWSVAAEYAHTHGLEMERKRRCAQLRYANDMHADVTAVVHVRRPTTPPVDSAGVVPDREAREYFDTNPKGYAWYFDRVAARLPRFLLTEAATLRAEAQIVALPPDDIALRPLARIVQLLKVHRNVHFEATPDLAPTSIVLTTLALQSYQELLDTVWNSPLDLLHAVVMRMPSHISRLRAVSGREVWMVRNPVMTSENLASRMNDDPARQRAFDEWLPQVVEDLLAVADLGARHGGQDRLVEAARLRFGKSAGRSIADRVQQAIERERTAGRVSVRPLIGGSSIAPAAIVLSSRQHTFFGS